LPLLGCPDENHAGKPTRDLCFRLSSLRVRVFNYPIEKRSEIDVSQLLSLRTVIRVNRIIPIDNSKIPANEAPTATTPRFVGKML
jgi:hypothetical protein